MSYPKWAVLLGISVLLAAVPAAFAAENGPRKADNDAPRIASARTLPAPAPARPAPSGTVSDMIGDIPGAPAGKMADTIAEYYASGKMRLHR